MKSEVVNVSRADNGMYWILIDSVRSVVSISHSHQVQQWAAHKRHAQQAGVLSMYMCAMHVLRAMRRSALTPAPAAVWFGVPETK